MAGVGTSILGRPRRLPRDRRASARYTLICEQPVNDGKPQRVIEKVLAHLEGVESPTVAALGLAFKPDIDDLRESPALAITRELADRLPQGQVLAVEPNIRELKGAIAEQLNVELTDLDAALSRADVVVLLVDHKEFKDFAGVQELTASVVDTRGAWRHR